MLLPSDQYPKLRTIDIRQVMHDGQPSLLLRDPLQISDRFLVISHGLGPALLFCDGKHNRAAIAGKLRSVFGLPVDVSLVNNLVDALDEALLLDNLRFKDGAGARAGLPIAPRRFVNRRLPGSRTLPIRWTYGACSMAMSLRLVR
jgi:hypothetical protein